MGVGQPKRKYVWGSFLTMASWFFSFLFNHTFHRAEATAATAECIKLRFRFQRFSHLAPHILVCVLFHCVYSTTKTSLGTIVFKGWQIHSSDRGSLMDVVSQASLSRLGLEGNCGGESFYSQGDYQRRSVTK